MRITSPNTYSATHSNDGHGSIRVSVPATEYKFEVLAIEASGNQTLTESTFTTP